MHAQNLLLTHRLREAEATLLYDSSMDDLLPRWHCFLICPINVIFLETKYIYFSSPSHSRLDMIDLLFFIIFRILIIRTCTFIKHMGIILHLKILEPARLFIVWNTATGLYLPDGTCLPRSVNNSWDRNRFEFVFISIHN